MIACVHRLGKKSQTFSWLQVRSTVCVGIFLGFTSRGPAWNIKDVGTANISAKLCCSIVLCHSFESMRTAKEVWNVFISCTIWRHDFVRKRLSSWWKIWSLIVLKALVSADGPEIHQIWTTLVPSWRIVSKTFCLVLRESSKILASFGRHNHWRVGGYERWKTTISQLVEGFSNSFEFDGGCKWESNSELLNLKKKVFFYFIFVLWNVF
jgi:hypothetical protein